MRHNEHDEMFFVDPFQTLFISSTQTHSLTDKIDEIASQVWKSTVKSEKHLITFKMSLVQDGTVPENLGVSV